MQIKVVIMPDGQMGLYMTNGSFADGKVALERVMADLGAAGIKFDDVGKPEQHKHDTQSVSAHTHNGITHSH